MPSQNLHTTPRENAVCNFSTINQTETALVSPQKFVNPPCCYRCVNKIQIFCAKMSPNGKMCLPSYLKNRSIGQRLKWWIQIQTYTHSDYKSLILSQCRSQRPRGLRRRSAAARLLRLWVRIPPGAWMFVCCECCVLSGRGLCDELITRPEESYRL